MENRKPNTMAVIFGIAVLLLVTLPLISNAAPAKVSPEGTLRIALATLGEEGWLPDLGMIEQNHMWTLVLENPLFISKKDPLTTKPGLMEGFEYSKDGFTLTMHIRKGIPWQGGWGEVTAEDVKYTYERLMRPTSTSIVKPVLVSTIKNIEIVDRHTVALRLKELAPEFWVQVFGITITTAPIICKKYVETVGDEKARFNPIGSGPYRLVEHKKGQHMKFEALEKHWRIVPEFKHILLQIIPEESTRVAMLKTGETDIAFITMQSIEDLRKTLGITIKPWANGNTIFAGFGGMAPAKDSRYIEGYHQKDPWMDKRVREAMSIAIDREAIVNSIYKGTAKPAPLSWDLPGWEKLPPIPYNPEKSKRLLTEAGYPKGFRVRVIATSGWAPSYEIPQVMEIVAAYFEKIGLKVDIVAMDKAQQNSMQRVLKDAGFIYPWREVSKVSWAGRHLTKFVPGADPYIFYSDELADLIYKYEGERNFERRAALLGQIRDYRYNNWVDIPIAFVTPIYAVRDKAVGEWPTSIADKNHNFEYIRHVKPLNTWRLFTLTP